MSSWERWLESALIGFLIWIAVVLLAYIFAPSRVSDVLLWQTIPLVRLTLYNIGTESEPFYEGTPLTILAFFVGVLLGFPIYTVITYAFWRLIERATTKNNRLGECLSKMKRLMMGH